MSPFATKPHALLVVENETVPHDRRVRNQARAARDNGYDVTVIYQQRSKRPTPKFEVLDGITMHRFSMPFGKNTRNKRSVFWAGGGKGVSFQG